MAKIRMSRRAQLLSGVGIAMLAATPALAGTTTVRDNTLDINDVFSTDYQLTAKAYETINAAVVNDEFVGATVSVDGGVTRVNTTTVGANGASSNTVTANSIIASATANSVSSTAGLLALDSGLNDAAEMVDGIALLSTSFNTRNGTDGYVIATAEASTIDVDLLETPNDTAHNDGNTISAQARINLSLSTVSGQVPNYYSSATGGSSVLQPGAYSETFNETTTYENQLTANGSIVVSTLQGAAPSRDSAANSRNNAITLDLISDAELGHQDQTGLGTLDDNTISALFDGNTSTSIVGIEGGTNPTFTGSAVISTSQISAGNSPEGSWMAYNNNSLIRGQVQSTESDTQTNNLTGTLSVTGNAITSSATSNRSVGNELTLDGGINVVGVTGSAIGFGGIGGGGAVSITTGGETAAAAGLVITGSQVNDGEYYEGEGTDRGQIASFTGDATISGYAQEIIGGTLNVSDNSITSTARGNQYGATIATTSAVNSIASGVALSTSQVNSEADVRAEVLDSLIIAEGGSSNTWNEYESAGEVSGASLSLTDNLVSAGAYGNQGANTIELNATSLNTGYADLAGLTNQTSGWNLAYGTTTLTSSQYQFYSDVSARNVDSSLYLGSNDYEGTELSTLLASGNQQDAVAVGNLVSNAIDLTATTTGTGVGLSNSQFVWYGSDVSAVFDGTAQIWLDEDAGESGATSVSLVDNTQRAVAYGNSADNTLSVAATSANIRGTGAFASSLDEFMGAYNSDYSAYGLLNVQGVVGNVTAETNSYFGNNPNFEIWVGEDVDNGSVLHNDGNSLIAAAYGSSATNAGTLDINTVAVTEFEGSNYTPIATIASAQYFDNEATISAQVIPGDSVIYTHVDDEVSAGGSLTTSGNTVLAQSLANNVVNTLGVQATTIYTAGDGGLVRADGDAEADAAFTINNMQSTDFATTVRSTLRDSFIEETNSAEIRTYVESDIEAASVVSLGNTLKATAGANRAVNALEVSATDLTATAAVNNNQITNSDVIATMGVAGTQATPGAFGDSFTGTVNLVYDTTTTIDGTYYNSLLGYSVYTSGLDPVLEGYLNSNGWTYGTYVGQPVLEYTLPTPTALGTYTTQPFTDTLTWSTTGGDGTSASGWAGGVFINADEDVRYSTLRVDGNFATATAIGNDAANSLNVTTTSLNQSSTYSVGTASDYYATGDFVLGNEQSAYETADATATVFNTFAIDQRLDETLTNSLLSVSGNRQSAMAVMNLADNALTLTATDNAESSTVTALYSDQGVYEASSVDALSLMVVRAPIHSSETTILLNDNTNTALGVHNDVTNTLTVSVTNQGSRSGNDATAGTGSNTVADNALDSTQYSDGFLDTTARSYIYNGDLVDASTNGVSNGTVEVNGNTTLAESTANRAVNTAIVNASANQGGNVALGNHQDNDSVVNSTAQSIIRIGMFGDVDSGASSSSTLSIDGNVTQALARGNAANNAVSTLAGATYPGVGGNTTGGAGSVDGSSAANAVVLNDQTNHGPINASANQTTYGVALNSGGGSPAVSNSTVNLNNNRVVAVAYGNQAANTLTLTPLNSGLPTGAINSVQYNSGAVTANTTSVTFHINASSGVTGNSAFRANGNAISATAVGNSVVSSIIAGR